MLHINVMIRTAQANPLHSCYSSVNLSRYIFIQVSASFFIASGINGKCCWKICAYMAVGMCVRV